MQVVRLRICAKLLLLLLLLMMLLCSAHGWDISPGEHSALDCPADTDCVSHVAATDPAGAPFCDPVFAASGDCCFTGPGETGDAGLCDGAGACDTGLLCPPEDQCANYTHNQTTLVCYSIPKTGDACVTPYAEQSICNSHGFCGLTCNDDEACRTYTANQLSGVCESTPQSEGAGCENGGLSGVCLQGHCSQGQGICNITDQCFFTEFDLSVPPICTLKPRPAQVGLPCQLLAKGSTTEYVGGACCSPAGVCEPPAPLFAPPVQCLVPADCLGCAQCSSPTCTVNLCSCVAVAQGAACSVPTLGGGGGPALAGSCEGSPLRCAVAQTQCSGSSQCTTVAQAANGIDCTHTINVGAACSSPNMTGGLCVDLAGQGVCDYADVVCPPAPMPACVLSYTTVDDPSGCAVTLRATGAVCDYDDSGVVDAADGGAACDSYGNCEKADTVCPADGDCLQYTADQTEGSCSVTVVNVAGGCSDGVGYTCSALGSCLPPVAPVLGCAAANDCDEQRCHTASCDPGGICRYLADDTNTNGLCQAPGSCLLGECLPVVAAPVQCPAATECTASYDSSGGICVPLHADADSPCQDGYLCDGAGSCCAPTCTSAYDCPDDSANPCRQPVCNNAGTGYAECAFSDQPTGTVCTVPLLDGSGDLSGACVGGQCRPAAPATGGGGGGGVCDEFDNDPSTGTSQDCPRLLGCVEQTCGTGGRCVTMELLHSVCADDPVNGAMLPSPGGTALTCSYAHCDVARGCVTVAQNIGLPCGSPVGPQELEGDGDTLTFDDICHCDGVCAGTRGLGVFASAVPRPFGNTEDYLFSGTASSNNLDDVCAREDDRYEYGTSRDGFRHHDEFRFTAALETLAAAVVDGRGDLQPLNAHDGSKVSAGNVYSTVMAATGFTGLLRRTGAFLATDQTVVQAYVATQVGGQSCDGRAWSVSSAQYQTVYSCGTLVNFLCIEHFVPPALRPDQRCCLADGSTVVVAGDGHDHPSTQVTQATQAAQPTEAAHAAQPAQGQVSDAKTAGGGGGSLHWGYYAAAGGAVTVGLWAAVALAVTAFAGKKAYAQGGKKTEEYQELEGVGVDARHTAAGHTDQEGDAADARELEDIAEQLRAVTRAREISARTGVSSPEGNAKFQEAIRQLEGGSGSTSESSLLCAGAGQAEARPSAATGSSDEEDGVLIRESAAKRAGGQGAGAAGRRK
jgi:hypothetical protein